MRLGLVWSAALSLFCSLAVTQFASNVGSASVQWAAAGDPQAIEARLSGFVQRMDAGAALPAVPVSAAGRPAAFIRTADSTERLDAAVSWVLAQGNTATVSANIATAIGIGSGQDVPVMQKAYRTSDDVIHRFFVSTTSGKTEIILVHQAADWSVGWRVTRAGAAIVTAYVDQNVRVVPNDQYADLLAGELAYWDSKVPPSAPAAANGTN